MAAPQVDVQYAETLRLAKELQAAAVLVSTARIGIWEGIIRAFGDKTPDIRTIAKIIDHDQLFVRYSRSGVCRPFLDRISALASLTAGDEYNTLVYLSSINLYGVFTPAGYSSFCADTYNNDGSVVMMTQMVLKEQPQKLIFCNPTVSEGETKRHTRDCLHAEVTTQLLGNGETEFTVQGIEYANFTEAMRAYDKLYSYISERNNAIALAMHPPHLHKLSGRSYEFSTSINNDLSVTDLLHKERIACAKTVSPITIVNQTIINNGGTNNIIGTNAQAAPAPRVRVAIPDGRTNATNWIRDNPPEARELKLSYYARYVDDNSYAKTKCSVLHDNQFGKLVMMENYKTVQGSQGRYWEPL